MSQFAISEDMIDRMHEEILKPAVRVTIGRGGGSGTILYSEDRGDGCQTFVLTNHHVIDSAILVKEEWSSLLQTDVKREVNDLVQVEIFKYDADSHQDLSDMARAEIVAHNKQHDLALLKLKTSNKFPNVAQLLPEDAKPRIFEPIWAVGCSLLHPPVATDGMINYLDDIIDRKVYWMGSAQIIFGNSGGAVFVEMDGHFYFIGVPSRVAGTGWQVVPHMGWFVPVSRIREWFETDHLVFLVDESVTPKACFDKRRRLQKDAELKVLINKRKSDSDTAEYDEYDEYGDES
jgi:hypothetical protein